MTEIVTAASNIVQLKPFIEGDFRSGDDHSVVVDKFSGAPVTSLEIASHKQVTEAVAAVARAQARTRLTLRERSEILATASRLVRERREQLIATIIIDSGFTRSDSIREVDRAAETLLVTAEETKRLVGEVVPMEGAPGIRQRTGFTTFHPLGVVCAITPFNSPLNTVLHKVGPAFAAGNGVVLKPAGPTPRTADALLRLLLDAGFPSELIAVIYGPGRTVGQWLLEDEKIDFFAFTGSTEIGRRIQQTVGLRHTQLEMGSLSSTIVCADAPVDRCVGLVVGAGFRKAGQVCTSVQRLYVERASVDEVAAELARRLAELPTGDPNRAETIVGPVISADDADRVSSWVSDAAAAGAEVLAGGERQGNVVSPTLLSNVTPEMAVMSREIFGPVVVIRPFDDLDTAIEEVNATLYGLSAGIFTGDLDQALRAAGRLRMGAVHINETSSSRVDLMPYTGVKASGRGVEGPRYAMREMSEQRLITLGPSSPSAV